MNNLETTTDAAPELPPIKAILTLSRIELGCLQQAALQHYDGACKDASREGGLLLDFEECFLTSSPEEKQAFVVDFSDLDLLSKISEMAEIAFRDTAVGQTLFGLRLEFNRLMAGMNKQVASIRGVLENSENAKTSAPPPTAPHADRSHSKISPSKLKSLEICPRWLPDQKESHVVTLAGTKMHEALDSGNWENLDEEERRLVQVCSDYLAALRGQMPGHQSLREQKLEIQGGVWGFADLILLASDQKSAELVDYKFAFNLQEPVETNPAAQAYVLGMFQQWPKLQKIGVHYLYPRLDIVHHAVYHRSQMAAISLRIKTITARVDGNAPAFPETGNCLYCGRQATCEALHKLALPIATRYHAAKSVAVPAVPDFSMVKDPEQWSVLMQWAPLLEATADSIKRHALEFRTEFGGEIPGYEMRTRAGKKKIVNAPIAWETAKAAGVTQEQFLRCVDVRVSDLADAVAENAPRGKKGSVKQALEDALRDASALEVAPDTHFLQRTRKTE